MFANTGMIRLRQGIRLYDVPQEGLRKFSLRWIQYSTAQSNAAAVEHWHVSRLLYIINVSGIVIIAMMFGFIPSSL